MLKLLQNWRKYRSICVPLVCAGLAAWWLLAAANYIGNEAQAHQYASYEKEALFLIGFGRIPVVAAGDIWSFIHENRDVIFAIITVVATAAIAIFTATIWHVNRSQLSHSRQTERAYVSGGGAPETRPERQWVGGLHSGGIQEVQVLTGNFVVCVNNYGKTPAALQWVGLGFCDLGSIPPNPVYEFRYRWDWVQPGDRGRRVFAIRIPDAATVIYGRFYYRDIFGNRYSSGFVNELGIERNRSEPVLAPNAYLEERTESEESWPRPDEPLETPDAPNQDSAEPA